MAIAHHSWQLKKEQVPQLACGDGEILRPARTETPRRAADSKYIDNHQMKYQENERGVIQKLSVQARQQERKTKKSINVVFDRLKPPERHD